MGETVWENLLCKLKIWYFHNKILKKLEINLSKKMNIHNITSLKFLI